MLLEVLMTLLIVGFAVTGVMVMMVEGQTYVAAQGQNRVAQHLAEQAIEGLRAVGFAGIATGARTDYPTSGSDGNQRFTRDICVTYVAKATLGEPSASDCSVGSVTSTKRIRVTVTPATASADAVTIETVVTNPT
jgi:type II secretory pathway pseudopilin PulG